jgi:hypothetical protein
MEELPFNPHEGDVRFASIAAFVVCDVSEVEAAFGQMFAFNLWAAERSENGQAKQEAKELRRMAEVLGNAKHSDLSDMRDELLFNANVAEHFTDQKAYPATRGRNERARVVANGVARLFANTGRNIGVGKDQYSGGPSTPFGRAVQHALSAFEINVHWYQPAKDARDNTN